MTLEEATARIAVLEAEAVTAKALVATTATDNTAKITKLNTENAERRVLNNQQKKSLFAAKHVIAKNNIKVNYEALGTDSLTLNAETGVVEGEVSYNPASTIEVGGGVSPASNGAPQAMTVESIKGMSRQDIAKNWDEVSAVLASQDTQQPNNTI
jgi:hypothetical protein